MHEIEYLYINVMALTDLKMSIDYYFELIPKKKEEKKNIIETNYEVKEEKLSFVRSPRFDLIKKNKFFIKKMKNMRMLEFKYKSELYDSKNNFNNQKTNIKHLYDKIIRNLKSQTKKLEVSKISFFIFEISCL